MARRGRAVDSADADAFDAVAVVEAARADPTPGLILILAERFAVSAKFNDSNVNSLMLGRRRAMQRVTHRRERQL